MQGYDIAEILMFNGQYPDGYVDLMVHVMMREKMGYQNPKTLAKFAVDNKAAVTGQTQVELTPSGGLKYDDSEHFIIFGLQLFSGANAVVGETDWDAGVVDAIAKNGTLDIVNNGTLNLKDFPLTKFLEYSGAGDPSASFVKLEKPITLRALSTLNVIVKFPTVVATANYNLNASLFGYKFI